MYLCDIILLAGDTNALQKMTCRKFSLRFVSFGRAFSNSMNLFTINGKTQFLVARPQPRSRLPNFEPGWTWNILLPKSDTADPACEYHNFCASIQRKEMQHLQKNEQHLQCKPFTWWVMPLENGTSLDVHIRVFSAKDCPKPKCFVVVWAKFKCIKTPNDFLRFIKMLYLLLLGQH